MRYVLIVLGLVALHPVAEAQTHRGAVLDFRGWRGAEARGAALRAARERLEIVSPQEVRGTGAMTSTDAGRAEVARALGLVLMIDGQVMGRGSRARTVVRVYDATGAQVGQGSGPAPLGGARIARIARATADAIDGAMAAVERQEAEARERERERQAEALRQEIAAREAAEQAEAEAPESGGDVDRTLPLVRLLVGVDGRSRSAVVDVEGGGREFSAPRFAVLTLAIQAYPLRGADGPQRGLYGQLDFAFASWLRTREAADPDRLLDTRLLQWGIHLGYLHALDDDVARIGALIGYGADSFAIEQNGTMPTAAYNYLRIGGAIDVKLYEQLLRARLDVGYRVTFGAGELGTTFGDQTSVGGFDIGVALTGQLDVGFTYTARLGFTRYGLTFDGTPDFGHPAAAEADRMVDRMLSYGIQVGYAY